jgi:hypothetical protein
VPYLARLAQVGAAKTLVSTFDQYCAAITRTDERQSYPPLIAAALRDLLHTDCDLPNLRTPIDYVLYLSVCSSGGDITTRQGLFTHNEHVGLIAGVSAAYVLIDRSGVVKTSGSVGGFSAARFNIDDNELRWTDPHDQ